jgi:hypothetical protein
MRETPNPVCHPVYCRISFSLILLAPITTFLIVYVASRLRINIGYASHSQ